MSSLVNGKIVQPNNQSSASTAVRVLSRPNQSNDLVSTGTVTNDPIPRRVTYPHFAVNQRAQTRHAFDPNEASAER